MEQVGDGGEGEYELGVGAGLASTSVISATSQDSVARLRIRVKPPGHQRVALGEMSSARLALWERESVFCELF